MQDAACDLQNTVYKERIPHTNDRTQGVMVKTIHNKQQIISQPTIDTRQQLYTCRLHNLVEGIVSHVHFLSLALALAAVYQVRFRRAAHTIDAAAVTDIDGGGSIHVASIAAFPSDG